MDYIITIAATAAIVAPVAFALGVRNSTSLLAKLTALRDEIKADLDKVHTKVDAVKDALTGTQTAKGGPGEGGNTTNDA